MSKEEKFDALEEKPRILTDYEDMFNNNRLNRFNSTDPNLKLKQLSSPRFVGSYHIKDNSDVRFKSFNNILKGDLQLNYTKSLKSIIFNPLTILFIILAMAFNFFWLMTLIL